MFQVIKTGWPQHGQETIPSKALLFVSWISRAMDWGPHNWVWDKAPVSWLKLSKFHQDLNPHLNFIFRPGHGILSWYWNSQFTRAMVRQPHHDNIKWVGLGQCILVLYYLSRTIHPVRSLLQISVIQRAPSVPRNPWNRSLSSNRFDDFSESNFPWNIPCLEMALSTLFGWYFFS